MEGKSLTSVVILNTNFIQNFIHGVNLNFIRLFLYNLTKLSSLFLFFLSFCLRIYLKNGIDGFYSDSEF